MPPCNSNGNRDRCCSVVPCAEDLSWVFPCDCTGTGNTTDVPPPEDIS